MIPLTVPDLRGNEARYLQDCVDTTFVSSVGAYVVRFEKELSQLVDSPIGVAVSSGTQALHLALLAAGVRANDLVLIPSFTFIASANAISHCGAKPWFVDVRAETWNLNEDHVESLVRSHLEKRGGEWFHKETKQRLGAILPIYTLGNVPDMDRLSALGLEMGVPIVADAAAAIGATYKGKPIAPFADFSIFSFNGNKTVTAGAGGIIFGRDEKKLQWVKHVSSTARTGVEYNHDQVAYNYRMTNLQAAVGCAQLERLPELVESKRRIRRRYDEAFSKHSGLGLYPPGRAGVDLRDTPCWLSGFSIEDKRLLPVTKWVERLKAKGVEARGFWKPLHLQAPYQDALRADLSVSEGLWSRVITLPCSAGLTDRELDTVIGAVEDILKA